MSRDINLLHPEVKALIPKFLEECKKKGLEVKVTDTVRTQSEQDSLYAQGRTKPGNIVTNAKYPYSNHNWGMAFDFCRNDGKGAYNDSDGWFSKVGAVAVSLGFEWGGNWKGFQDKPHIELTKYGSTEQLRKKYGTPENFKKTWKETVVSSSNTNKPKIDLLKRLYSYNSNNMELSVIENEGSYYTKIRDICELLNKNVSYDNVTKATTISDKINNIKISYNKNDFSVKAVNINGNNFVNLRELCDILNIKVNYDNETKSISLINNNILSKIFKK